MNEWKVGSHNGSSARLECLVESLPAADTHWENKFGRKMESGDGVVVRYEPDLYVHWRVGQNFVYLNYSLRDCPESSLMIIRVP